VIEKLTKQPNIDGKIWQNATKKYESKKVYQPHDQKAKTLKSVKSKIKKSKNKTNGNWF